MRSDFIQSDVQDANERRRQPVAAFNAAPGSATESFASFLTDPREAAFARAQNSALVAAAPPGPPVSPFKGISAFTGSPAVIPSAVVPPVDALVETPPPATTESPIGFAATQPTPAEIAPASDKPAPSTPGASAETSPATSALSGRRQPTPAFAAAKAEVAQAPAPTELVKGAAAYGARGLTAEESAAMANGEASMTSKGPSLFGDEGMTAADFFSIINPLQHLPLVGALYRDLTGDTIKPGARVLGGMLFGGPVGMVSGAFNAALEQDIGTDTGGALLALVRGQPIGGASDTNLASAPLPAPAAASESAPVAAPANLAVAAPKALTPAAAATPAPAPLPVSAPRVFSPPKQPAPAEARVITPASTPAPAIAGAEAAQAESARSAIPVSLAGAAPAQPSAAGKEFPIAAGGKDFAVPARMNNVQPRQPVPVVRADLSRARELAPMAPLTARSESPRPDHTPSPAQLLTPGLTPSGLTPSGLTPSGLMTPGLTPGAASNMPLGMPGLPQSALPDAMTRALDKYDALLKSRKGGVVNQQS